MRQVFLYGFNCWVDIINENDLWYAAICPDNINIVVYKEGSSVR